MVHAVNLCEVFYDTLKRSDGLQAKAIVRGLREIGLVEMTDCDEAFWQTVAGYKAQFRRISLADCFALALTVSRNATLITSDHHEFDPVAATGVCPMHFIR
jgi:predicted nucleic acid-binding protein